MTSGPGLPGYQVAEWFAWNWWRLPCPDDARYMRAVPKPFDILNELGKFGAQHKIAFNDPNARQAFASYVSDAVERALADPGLLHGQRTEAMFEALLLALGRFRLLKREDGGPVHPTEDFVAPDFRVVLEDGRQWVIEVKNIHLDEPMDLSMREFANRDYLEKLERYAKSTGAELKFAIYWSRWSVWTLISPNVLKGADGTFAIDMVNAITADELSELGDLSIATRSPLTLRLTADPDYTDAMDDDGFVRTQFNASHIMSEDRVLHDRAEHDIAWMLIRYGEWEEEPMRPIVEDDRLIAVEISWRPVEESEQGFERIGRLSRMFARYYAEHTLGEQGVVALRAPLRPKWFEPLLSSPEAPGNLPLWRFSLKPNHELANANLSQMRADVATLPARAKGRNRRR